MDKMKKINVTLEEYEKLKYFDYYRFDSDENKKEEKGEEHELQTGQN